MTVRPSGETSTDIQVPSLVVKRSERGVGGTGARVLESCASMAVGESAAPPTSTAASMRAVACMAMVLRPVASVWTTPPTGEISTSFQLRAQTATRIPHASA